MYDIITEKKSLSTPCAECIDLERGQETGELLLSLLKMHKTGVGLAANQVGINKRICVINVDRPIVLINPKVVGQFGKIIFKEGCLSFPGDYIITERYADIAVRAANHPNIIYFNVSKNALECVCVQHEIDHLDGITMFERRIEEK